ncbi:hypothetical protein Hs30E_00380 [Lactococcus hodotermopsidis]|uniref:Aldose 1-epimerase n=1 Tax=Pseudolactococcus hodotermopsidis TaxID=2709157 RepID=A0A6A0BCD8_9LACT|nr:DUF1912 family protein [Lactococcus hodotermopsidis]GFH41487.1 hypothetical protein Hs30E_00380 [Lactococcus hodotermopsidis]
MTYEQEFLKDFGDWVATQVAVHQMAMVAAQEEMANGDERAKDAVIRYESRLSAYQFLAGKFENYQAGKGFHDLPDGLFEQVNY